MQKLIERSHGSRMISLLEQVGFTKLRPPKRADEPLERHDLRAASAACGPTNSSKWTTISVDTGAAAAPVEVVDARASDDAPAGASGGLDDGEELWGALRLTHTEFRRHGFDHEQLSRDLAARDELDDARVSRAQRRAAEEAEEADDDSDDTLIVFPLAEGRGARRADAAKNPMDLLCASEARAPPGARRGLTRVDVILEAEHQPVLRLHSRCVATSPSKARRRPKPRSRSLDCRGTDPTPGALPPWSPWGSLQETDLIAL